MFNLQFQFLLLVTVICDFKEEFFDFIYLLINDVKQKKLKKIYYIKVIVVGNGEIGLV